MRPLPAVVAVAALIAATLNYLSAGERQQRVVGGWGGGGLRVDDLP